MLELKGRVANVNKRALVSLAPTKLDIILLLHNLPTLSPKTRATGPTSRLV